MSRPFVAQTGVAYYDSPPDEAPILAYASLFRHVLINRRDGHVRRVYSHDPTHLADAIVTFGYRQSLVERTRGEIDVQ